MSKYEKIYAPECANCPTLKECEEASGPDPAKVIQPYSRECAVLLRKYTRSKEQFIPAGVR